MLYPSASLVRSYESWVAVAKDGEEYSGVLRRDTPEEVVIATGPGAETRVRRSDLAELRLGLLSIMPAGLDEQLSRQDLADLLAFLKNTKWGVNSTRFPERRIVRRRKHSRAGCTDPRRHRP